MHRRRSAVAPAWGALSLALLGSCAADPRARGPGGPPPGAVASINAALDEFHDAAARADVDRYFSRWAADSVFLGTDASERWTGQEFRDFALPFFARGTGWTYRPRDRRVSIDPSGRFAWFDELLDNDRLGECRGSGVLARRADQWIILQYNLSIPIPNDLAPDTAARIAEWKRRNPAAP